MRVRFDNDCVAEPFHNEDLSWAGFKVTLPDGSVRYVGLSLSDGDERGDITAFFYEGDSPDLGSAECASDVYIPVYDPEADK